MSRIIAVPLNNGVVTAEITAKGFNEIARIPFSHPAKCVVCENGLVVSLVKNAADCFIYAHEIVNGGAILKWEKLLSDEIRYSHIEVRGDVVYLATLCRPTAPFESLIYIDFSKPEYQVMAFSERRNEVPTNILNFKVCGASLYVFENNYPMAVYEYDITAASIPRFRVVRELKISTHLQFVKNFAVSQDRMAIITNYNDNLNLSNYLHVYGPSSFTFKSYFEELYRDEQKYVELRDEMGLLPESVELDANYSRRYSVRRKMVKPFSRFIQAFFSHHITRSRRFNVKSVSYLTDEIIHLDESIRIVDVMFNGDVLFFIANGKVCALDFSREGRPSIESLSVKVELPIKLVNPFVPNHIIVRSCSDYELVALSNSVSDRYLPVQELAEEEVVSL